MAHRLLKIVLVPTTAGARALPGAKHDGRPQPPTPRACLCVLTPASAARWGLTLDAHTRPPQFVANYAQRPSPGGSIGCSA